MRVYYKQGNNLLHVLLCVSATKRLLNVVATERRRPRRAAEEARS